MRYVIDKTRRPAYLQLYKAIRDDIIGGIYPYNAKLPSEHTLAEETGLSTITHTGFCATRGTPGRAREAAIT